LFFDVRNRLRLRSLVVTYIVIAMDGKTSGGLIGRSIEEGDVVVANSRHVGETIHRMFGVRAQTIYDGIDRRYFYPPELRPETRPPVVLYAGSLQPRKRVDLIVEQAARWPTVQFRLAGKGETETACRKLAEELECRNVVFLGHLSAEQLGEEMRRASIFFFPSILEGNPQVLLQASACGLPCIAMDLYRSDYVVSGKTGFLAASDMELTDSLNHLIHDEPLREKLSAAAIRHAGQFDWNDITQQWSVVFEEALERRSANLRGRAS
jgi:glycosyltransferase involved in cell wall biosynthesis